jgi:hypothetical protein
MRDQMRMLLVLPLIAILCCSLIGCWTSVSNDHVPGMYVFSRSGYTTRLEIRKDGTYTQSRKGPGNILATQVGHWRAGPLEDHITLDHVLPFFPQDSIDLSKTTFYTPEVDVLWFRVCLLVDGNNDLEMCKEI